MMQEVFCIVYSPVKMKPQLSNSTSPYLLGQFENAKFLKIILEHVDLAVIHKK